MNASKKILYLMHIDWGWAKQRPHFIAEQLADRYEVTVAFRLHFRKGVLSKNKAHPKLKTKILFILPFSRFGIIRALNKFFIKIQLIPKIASDIVWVTHPVMFEYIKNNLKKGSRLVYDCMDDALSFPDVIRDKKKFEALKSIEKQLIDQAHLVISSSVNLRKKLTERYDCQEKMVVVNNALAMPNNGNFEIIRKSSYSVEKFLKIDGIKILYIGTISSWLDFESLADSLARFEKIVFVFIGPCEIEPPKHERIIILPPVEHGHVLDLMRSSDALIMPFHVNDLIKSVNPVKVYEYIYSMKPALVVSYEETQLFKDYVYLYESRAELNHFIALLVSNNLRPKSSEVDAVAFLKKNTWDSRARTISSLIESEKILR